MIKLISAKTLSYLILILLMLFFSLLFLNLSAYRILIAFFIGLTYFIWGLITHWRDHTLHLSIILEYASLGLLAVILLIFISLRA